MMKTRIGYLVTGLLALALSSSAVAHESGQYVAYPDSMWSGSAAVWAHPQGFSGWSGSLSFGAVQGYPTGYLLVAPMPSGHRHLASCRHAPPRHYAHARNKHYKHGRGHAPRRFEPHPGHH